MTSVPRRRQGFTLVELLVVIGIIAALISILLPALVRAKESANRTKCMSNQKQLLFAVRMYADENKDYLPHSGWASQFDSAGNDITGTKARWNWLHDSFPTATPVPGQINTSEGTAWNIKSGLLYKYLKTDKVFRCPQDEGPWQWGPAQRATSYGFNGSVNWYGQPPNQKVTYFKLSMFKADDVLLWETREEHPEGAAKLNGYWNDGANYPREGISRRHGSKSAADPTKDTSAGAIVGCFGGNVDRMTMSDFYKESGIDVTGQTTPGKHPGRLWNVPRRYSLTGD